jgi:hypothetical protein
MSKSNGKDHHEGELEPKFADFDKMVAEAKHNGIEAVLVPSPQTLGDTYEELIRNLTKLQEKELSFVIVPKPKKMTDSAALLPTIKHVSTPTLTHSPWP